MNEIDIMRWIRAESGKARWTGRHDRDAAELLMAAAYAKGRDDQEDFDAPLVEHFKGLCIEAGGYITATDKEGEYAADFIRRCAPRTTEALKGEPR